MERKERERPVGANQEVLASGIAQRTQIFANTTKNVMGGVSKSPRAVATDGPDPRVLLHAMAHGRHQFRQSVEQEGRVGISRIRDRRVFVVALEYRVLGPEALKDERRVCHVAAVLIASEEEDGRYVAY